MIALLALFTASAQESGCSVIYSEAELDTALAEADRLISSADVDRAINVLRKTQDLMPCLDTLVDRRKLATFGRAMALASFYQQDEVASTRWGRMTTQTDPDLGWDLPETHPLLSLLEEAGESPIGGPQGVGLLVPKKGAIFMNGTFATKPEARAEVPYLVQVFNGNGWPIRGHWQDGSAFPEDLLTEEIEEPKLPKWYDPLTGEVKPKGKPPTPGKEGGGIPMPTTAIAGGLVVASGVLYALAGTQASKVSCNPEEKDTCPTTPEELAQAQSAANWMTLGAGVLFAGGVGVGVTGFVLDGGSPGLVISGRFR